MAIANFDLVKISGVSCLKNMNFYNSFMFMLVLPLMVLAFLFIVMAVGRRYFNRKLNL